MLAGCIKALQKQTYKQFEIIVVENGSVDGSGEYLAEKFPEVIVLQQAKNLGFAGGVNVGLRYSSAQYKVLLNNDTEVEPTWLDELVRTADTHKDAFAVVSKILDAKSKKASSASYKIDSTGDQYSVWGLPFPRGRGELDKGKYDQPEEVFAACGGSVLYRATALDKVGLFDEDFFAYYEDVDISFRARLAGYKVYYQPKSIVFHAIGATSGGKPNSFTRFHSVKNSYYLYLKNMPGWLFWKYLPRFFVSQMLTLAGSVKNGLLLTHLKGSLWAIVFTPKKILERIRIQHARKIQSQEIEPLLYHKLPPLQEKLLRRILKKHDA